MTAKRIRKNTSGGRAPPSGVSLQSAIGACMAVHALAKRGVGRAFGTVETAHPQLIRHETRHGIDDVEVVLSDGGRLLFQATRQPSQKKVAEFLAQATKTFLGHKTSEGAAIPRPLVRSKDAMVLAVPGKARKNLDDLGAVFRQFDTFDKWADVPLAGLTAPQARALAAAKATLVASWTAITGAAPADDELVELFGLLRIARFDLDRGQAHDMAMQQLLTDGIGLSELDASKAWDRLCRDNVHWMQHGTGADRAGIARFLKTISVDVDGLDGSVAEREAAVEQPAGLSGDELAQRLLAEAERRFPPHLADEELRRLTKRVRQRVNFNDPSVNYSKEIGDLARRGVDGDLSRASADARWTTIVYAARSAASRKETLIEARELMAAAEKIAPGRSDVVVDAALGAHDDINAALKLLRELKTPDARSQLAGIIAKDKGPQAALDWIRTEKLTAADFTSIGVHNVTMMALEVNDVDFATSWIEGVTEAQLRASPSLLALRADFTVAKTLPPDQRDSVIVLPLDFRDLHTFEDADSIQTRRGAAADLARLLDLTRELGLPTVAKRVEERLCWLQGLDPDKRDAAKARIADGLTSEPARWVRLALRFNVNFDRDELRRRLERLRGTGGWSADEGTAYLLMEMESHDYARVAAFIGENRKALEQTNFTNRLTLMSIEVQALARCGGTVAARARMEEGVPAEEAELRALLESVIAESEGSVDPIALARARFARTGRIDDLRQLCDALHKAGKRDELIGPAKDLARRARTVADMRGAVGVLTDAGKHAEALKLLAELPTVGAGDPVIEKRRAECQVRTGDYQGARQTLEDHFGNDIDPYVAHVWVSLEIESGQWANLQGLVERALRHKDRLGPLLLIQLANIAREVGSGHVQEYVEAAIARAGNDARVYLGAYLVALGSGKESRDLNVHGWFQRAVELSGDDGPIQQKSIRDVAAMAPAWRAHEERIGDLLQRGEAPLFFAAESLNVDFVRATLGRAHANSEQPDGARRSPILAFDGSRKEPEVLKDVSVVAADVSSLMTLGFVGAMDLLVRGFSKVVIAPGTLALLFEERQRVRFHQPSLVERAKRLRKLLDDGNLKVFPAPSPLPAGLLAEVGEDLAGMLLAASADGGIVVRPAPLHKVGSLMETLADVGAFEAQLTDTRQVLAYAKAEALLKSELAEGATLYIMAADAGLPGAVPVETGRNIYLDDLAVSYLEYTQVLEPFCRKHGRVFIPSSLENEINALIAHEQFAAKYSTASSMCVPPWQPASSTGPSSSPTWRVAAMRRIPRSTGRRWRCSAPRRRSRQWSSTTNSSTAT